MKELGLELVRMWVLMATVSEIQLDWIAMKSGVTSQPSPPSHVNIYVERQKLTCPSRGDYNAWRRIHHSCDAHLPG